MNGLDIWTNGHAGPLVVALGVTSLLALILALAGLVRLRVVMRRFAWATGGDSAGNDSLDSLLRTVDANHRHVAELRAAIDRVIEDQRRHFSRIGLVRYDAFEGVAGQQSYSLCLLDDERNGVLLSTLVGREFSRGYAVEIRAGEPSRKLGDEESSALTAALKNSH